MKRFIVILLALFSLAVSMQYSFTWLLFKVNQSYIAKNLCVQKEVEDNTCQGCCQLNKQLEQQEEQNKSNPNQRQRKLLIDFFNTPSISIHPPDSYRIIDYQHNQRIHINGVYTEVFKPPQV